MKVAVVLSHVNLPSAVPFYCMRCRSMLFMQNRDILTIHFGGQYPTNDIPKGMGWIQMRCHSCKTDWNFYYQ
jgi:hypothetical protein